MELEKQIREIFNKSDKPVVSSIVQIIKERETELNDKLITWKVTAIVCIAFLIATVTCFITK